MTALLAIVRSVTDASAALVAGADRAAVLTTASAISGSLPRGCEFFLPERMSAEWDSTVLPSALSAAPAALWLPFEPAWHAAIRLCVSAGVSVYGVVEPKQALGPALPKEAARLGCCGLIVGTPFGSRLLDAQTVAVLAAFVGECRRHHLFIAFAGGLEFPDLPRLSALKPDAIAADSILLDAFGQFDGSVVGSLRTLLTHAAAPDNSLADLASSPEPDRIFVRDWVVSMSIGAYERERHALQRVRFSVEASLLPVDHREGMAGVVSYDLITDAIARLTAEHVTFVESLAEDLAQAVLAEPRVVRVDIAVEKLDIGPGSVGCRFVRERTGSRP